MADTPTPDPQSATPSGSTPTGATPTSGSTTQQKPAMTIEEALAKIADLERHSTNKDEEAKRHGSKLTAAEKELAAYKEKERLAQEAALSEAEKLNKRATEAEQRIQQLTQKIVTSETKLVAQSMGFHSPDIAAKVVQDLLEFGEDGMPTNLEDALKTVAKNNPFMVRSEKPAEPPAPTPAQTAQPNAPATPAIPAMNPGRSSISSPGTLPPNKPTRLSDVPWTRK